MSYRYLFCLDIDGIQDYIFCTNRLRTIAGASSIIYRLNHDETIKKLKNRFGFGEHPEESERFVYSDGGNSIIVFENEHDAYEFEKEIHRLYTKAGLSITTHIESFNSNTENQYGVLKQSSGATQQKKYNKKAITSLPSSPYFKFCENCGKEYAQYIVKPGDSRAMAGLAICRLCEDKVKEPIEKFAGLPFRFKSQLEEIKGKNGMIALMVMDGNGMAKKIDTVTGASPNNAFAALKKFSHQTKQILIESMNEVILQWQKEDGFKEEAELDFIRPIILGGDDICCIIKSQHGLDLTLALIRRIKEKSLKFTDNLFGNGIHMSAGIVYMRHNYPFNVGYRVAHSLLHSAKRLSVKNDDKSMIDFHVMQSASALDIQAIREQEYTYEMAGNVYRLTAKPLCIDKLKKPEIKTIEEFKERLEVLKQTLASSKMEYIRSILRKGQDMGTYELAKIASKMNIKNNRKFYDCFLKDNNSWFKDRDELKTDLMDLIEMSDLMEVNKQNGAFDYKN